jgi:phosphate transport system permease protein
MSTTAIPREAIGLHSAPGTLTWNGVGPFLDQYAAPAGGLLAASLALGLAGLSVATLDAEPLVMPAFLVMIVVELFLLAHVFHQSREVDPALVVVLGMTIIAGAVDGALPVYFSALGQSAIFHRSVASIFLLIAIAVPLFCCSLYHLLGGSPSASDAARYPLVVLPALALLTLYLLLLGTILVRGIPELSWEVVNTRMPSAATAVDLQPGLANHILGTLLLIALTALISLPIGTATGVFLNEYAQPRVAQVVRFCTTALRGISVLLLALTAVNLLVGTQDTPLGFLFTGSYDVRGETKTQGGSFLLAAAVISMLVVPVIARATEEGCRSVPAGLREGSAALGATDTYTLRRIIFPWALPNIITSGLLGSAEAAGSLATLLFIGATGEAGVGPLRPVTSLSYAIFDATYSIWKPFRDAIEPHRWGAALLLLLIALGLTAAGLVLKYRYASRYRS